MKMKKRESGGGANWMDTYGDMVTLLLCFFVLLYSMSTIDSAKWQAIVQSFNPSASRTQTETPGGSGPNADSNDGEGGPMPTPEPNDAQTPEEAQAEINAAIEQLYQAIQEYSQQNDVGKNMDVTKGDGYVFVSFNDAVFFNGDSFTLREDGRAVLDAVSAILDHAKQYIDEVRIMGHTAQARANQPNDTYKDRMLSSQRSTVATWYIQEHCGLDPARLVSVGYGQHRPIALNDVEEHRSQNRRVEMMITGLDVMNQMGDNIQQYYSLRQGEGTTNTTETSPAPEASPLPETSGASAASGAPAETGTP